MADRYQRAAVRAAREVNELLGREHMQAAFKVERFGRHRDGFLHAQVSLNGHTYYVHRRFGSWLMPGHIGGKSVLREVVPPFNAVLQEHARPYDIREREERDANRRQSNRGGKAVPAAGVPEGGDRGDAVQGV